MRAVLQYPLKKMFLLMFSISQEKWRPCLSLRYTPGSALRVEAILLLRWTSYLILSSLVEVTSRHYTTEAYMYILELFTNILTMHTIPLGWYKLSLNFLRHCFCRITILSQSVSSQDFCVVFLFLTGCILHLLLSPSRC